MVTMMVVMMMTMTKTIVMMIRNTQRYFLTFCWRSGLRWFKAEFSLATNTSGTTAELDNHSWPLVMQASRLDAA
jgi:hypothetical protein